MRVMILTVLALAGLTSCSSDDGGAGGGSEATACTMLEQVMSDVAEGVVTLDGLAEAMQGVADEASGTDLEGPAEALVRAAESLQATGTENDDEAIATETQRFATLCAELE